MRYPFHTTTHEQRLKLLEQEGRLIDINIDDFLCPSIAIDEDTNTLYNFDYSAMIETLKEFDNHIHDPEQTTYWKTWHEKKGDDSTRNRIQNFHELYTDIKNNGLKEPVVVERTGQKVDGSHRCAVMKHLGHKTIPARETVLTELTNNYIKKTLEAREKIYGKNYYFISYGEFVNISGDVPQVYRENSYDRWGVLKDLILGEDIVDLGCNEGFISLMCAMGGRKVIGYEYEFADGANFTKSVFENLYGKLQVEFVDADITKIDIPKADTYLVLNVIYHVPKDKQVELLRKVDGRIIFQCNLRKAHEADKFRGCTVEGIKELCELSGKQIIKVIEWRDKPIVIVK